MARQKHLQNPQLSGDSFFWAGGRTGILLFHGFTATTAEVRPLAQTLHQAGYTVAGPLLPGHGATPQDLNRCRWTDWVAAAEQAYQELASRRQLVFVGGESMGGLLTLYLASQHPEIAGLFVYAPALQVPSRILPLIIPFLAPFFPTRPKSPSAALPADARWQGYTVYPTRAAAQLFKLQRIVRRLLHVIQQPILIVHGRLDQAVDPKSPEIIYQRVKSEIKELHWLENSGHCVILDGEWEQAAARTEAFIKRVLASKEQTGAKA